MSVSRARWKATFRCRTRFIGSERLIDFEFVHQDLEHVVLELGADCFGSRRLQPIKLLHASGRCGSRPALVVSAPPPAEDH
jgi:hypothetical protein